MRRSDQDWKKSLAEAHDIVIYSKAGLASTTA